MVTSPEINQIAAALSAAQGELDGAKKSANNPFFNHKYADLASVKEAMREPFAKHGLSVVQFPLTTFSGEPTAYEWTAKRSGEVRYGVRVFTTVSVVTRLMHTSGQWIQGDPVAALLPNGDPQAVGSAITYLRRYALQAVAGIAAEDDDAEATAQGTGAAVGAITGPVPAPVGYPEWLDRLRARANEGTTAFDQAWAQSADGLRKHLTVTNLALWNELRAIAARRVA